MKIVNQDLSYGFTFVAVQLVYRWSLEFREYASVNNTAQVYVATAVSESRSAFIIQIGFDGILIVDGFYVGNADGRLSVPVLVLFFKPLFIGLAEHIEFKSSGRNKQQFSLTQLLERRSQKNT